MARKSLSSIVVCLGFLSAAALGAEKDGTGLTIRKARETQPATQAAMLKSTDDRIIDYTKAIAAHPDAVEYQTLLAGAYLQKVRETGDGRYLDRATQLVENVISDHGDNYEALRLRTELEMNRHHFELAAVYSRDLTQLFPADASNFGILGDALMELGQYERAKQAYEIMVKRVPNLFSYNRLAYYTFITGNWEGALQLMKAAVAAGSPSPEHRAWCLVELGDLYFKAGHWDNARTEYMHALATFANYHRAYAGLGRVQGAQGDTLGAIESYRHAQAIIPLPEYASNLEYLYSLKGMKEEARKQSELLDVVDRLARANHETTNRNLALAYADTDRNLDRALELVEAEMEGRKDVYSYDALAWVLYKNKRFHEAELAMEQALKEQTPEPIFNYHAGMIAEALGKRASCVRHLRQALSLNAKFDLRQAAVAELTLRNVRTSGFVGDSRSSTR
ncbi:MAG: tetratricopeptide repeat protein [Bryobacteraceae bacterium]